MDSITINGKTLEFEHGKTILDLTRELDIDIPTMCHMEGHKRFTSCMVCQVKEHKTGKLFPACSTPAEHWMDLDTECDEVKKARKAAVELLLSEHLGDCEGPCTMFCPANMNIPKMIRQIAAEDFEGSLETVKEAIALPAVLGRICPAPCENGCRRKAKDAAVGICKLKRFVADEDLSKEDSWLPEKKPNTGKRVAIVGSGPAGLAVAWHLLQEGHDCVCFERQPTAGGALRYKVPEDALPGHVLDAEIELIQDLGLEFRFSTSIGREVSLEQLRSEFDAIALVVGAIEQDEMEGYGLELGPTGFKVDRKTCQTSDTQIFAWTSKATSKMAIRAIAAGKGIAASINQYLSGQSVIGPGNAFNSRLAKPQDVELDVFMRVASSSPRVEHNQPYPMSDAIAEAKRCLHCDCRARSACVLRDHSTTLGANQKSFEADSRKPFTQFNAAEGVLLEPGKCIKCGICVRICEEAGVPDGFTFIKRGYDVRISTPFNKLIPEEHAEVVAECVEACPTGAIAAEDAE